MPRFQAHNKPSSATARPRFDLDPSDIQVQVNPPSETKDEDGGQNSNSNAKYASRSRRKSAKGIFASLGEKLGNAQHCFL